MAFIEDIKDSLSPMSTDDGTTEYQCVDCFTAFDDEPRICSTCGGGEFDRV